MDDYLIACATGALLMTAYMVMGIGVTRMIAKSDAEDGGVRLFEIFFWPIALGVIAANGKLDRN